MASASPLVSDNQENQASSLIPETEPEKETLETDPKKETLRDEDSDKGKIVNDAIFGFIHLKLYILAIIDTPEFQRLRRIWQLGATPFVYPTADHSRFEHSIGTYHLASRLIKKLKKQLIKENADIVIDDKDVMCVEIAALCHDIGQGPFSRFWDKVILHEFTEETKNKSSKLFTNIWNVLKDDDRIKRMLEDNKLDETHEQLIEAIIKGEKIEGKEILSCIVSNSESGMDVDKWDYLARDSTYLGHSSTNYRVDIERMIKFARAIKDKDGKWKVAFRDTEGLNMARVYQFRHYLYKTAYMHRTVVAIELMMLDGFKTYFNKEENKSLKDKIGTSEWILENDDSIFWSNVKNVPEFERILRRNLYRKIFEAVRYKLQENDPTKEMIEYLNKCGCGTSMVRIRQCVFKLGNTNSNPMLSIPFYKKGDLKNVFKYTESNIPLRFTVNETKIIVFSTLDREDREEKEMENKEKIKKNLKVYFDEINKKAEKEKEKWMY